MKNLFLFICLFSGVTNIGAQVLGNAYYLNRVDFSNQAIIPNITVNANDDDIYINIQGLANVKTDAYVAIFNVGQMAETVDQVNTLIDQRINSSLEQISKLGEIETFIDMISFVPVYEIETIKKKFRKDTHNEIPVGFEVKKNLHIKYKDPNYLPMIIAILSQYEIYDMVRVDYFSEELAQIKKDMQIKAKELALDKIGFYEELMNEKLDTNVRQLSDGYSVTLPPESYRSYQSYSSTTFNEQKTKDVTQATICKTHYYQPIMDKDFDFVINPTILEPVIQVTYSINMKIMVDRKPHVTQKIVEKKVIETEKKFILVTPEGALKNIN